MIDMPPQINAAWADAVLAIGKKLGRPPPLPPGISRADIGDWTLLLNNSPTMAEIAHEVRFMMRPPMPPFTVLGVNNACFALVLIDPNGGIVGGYSEDMFIADMNAAVSPPVKGQTP